MGRHNHGTSIRDLLRKVSDDTLDRMAAVHQEPVAWPWPPSPVPREVPVPNDPVLAMRTLPYRVPPEVERMAARMADSWEFARLVSRATMSRSLAQASLAHYTRMRLGKSAQELLRMAVTNARRNPT